MIQKLMHYKRLSKCCVWINSHFKDYVKGGQAHEAKPKASTLDEGFAKEKEA